MSCGEPAGLGYDESQHAWTSKRVLTEPAPPRWSRSGRRAVSDKADSGWTVGVRGRAGLGPEELSGARRRIAERFPHLQEGSRSGAGTWHWSSADDRYLARRSIASVFDYAARQRRLSERMHEEGVDLLFLGISSDLEYLSGVERGVPFSGRASIPTAGWRAGSSGPSGPVSCSRAWWWSSTSGTPRRRDRGRRRDRRRGRGFRAGRRGSAAERDRSRSAIGCGRRPPLQLARSSGATAFAPGRRS